MSDWFEQNAPKKDDESKVPNAKSGSSSTSKGDWFDENKPPESTSEAPTTKPAGMLDKLDQKVTSSLAPTDDYSSWLKTEYKGIPKTLGREIYSGAKGAASLLDPRTYYHAFADEPTKAELEEGAKTEKALGEAPGTESKGLKRVGLGLERLTGLGQASEAAPVVRRALLGDVHIPAAAEKYLSIPSPAPISTEEAQRKVLNAAPEVVGGLAGTIVAGKAAGSALGSALPKVTQGIEKVSPGTIDMVKDFAKEKAGQLKSNPAYNIATADNVSLRENPATTAWQELKDRGAQRIATSPVRFIGRHPAIVAGAVTAAAAPHTIPAFALEILGTAAGEMLGEGTVAGRQSFLSKFTPDWIKDFGLNDQDRALAQADRVVNEAKRAQDIAYREASPYMSRGGEPIDEYSTAGKKAIEAWEDANKKYNNALADRTNAVMTFEMGNNWGVLKKVPKNSPEFRTLLEKKMSADNLRRFRNGYDNAMREILERLPVDQTESEYDLKRDAEKSMYQQAREDEPPTRSAPPAAAVPESLRLTGEATPEQKPQLAKPNVELQDRVNENNLRTLGMSDEEIRKMSSEEINNVLAKTGAKDLGPSLSQEVEDQAALLSQEMLRNLAKEHGLDPDSYGDFKRDRTYNPEKRRYDISPGRTRLARDIVNSMDEDELSHIERYIDEKSSKPEWKEFETSGKARAQRAASLFPRLRGIVDEFGNPRVAGGSFDTPAEIAEAYLREMARRGIGEGDVLGSKAQDVTRSLPAERGEFLDTETGRTGTREAGATAESRPSDESAAARRFMSQQYPGQEPLVREINQSPEVLVPEAMRAGSAYTKGLLRRGMRDSVLPEEGSALGRVELPKGEIAKLVRDYERGSNTPQRSKLDSDIEIAANIRKNLGLGHAYAPTPEGSVLGHAVTPEDIAAAKTRAEAAGSLKYAQVAMDSGDIRHTVEGYKTASIDAYEDPTEVGPNNSRVVRMANAKGAGAGTGKLAYQKMFESLRKQAAASNQPITVLGGNVMSPDAVRVWNELGKQGYDVQWHDNPQMPDQQQPSVTFPAGGGGGGGTDLIPRTSKPSGPLGSALESAPSIVEPRESLIDRYSRMIEEPHNFELEKPAPKESTYSSLTKKLARTAGVDDEALSYMEHDLGMTNEDVQSEIMKSREPVTVENLQRKYNVTGSAPEKTGGRRGRPSKFTIPKVEMPKQTPPENTFFPSSGGETGQYFTQPGKTEAPESTVPDRKAAVAAHVAEVKQKIDSGEWSPSERRLSSLHKLLDGRDEYREIPASHRIILAEKLLDEVYGPEVTKELMSYLSKKYSIRS